MKKDLLIQGLNEKYFTDSFKILERLEFEEIA